MSGASVFARPPRMVPVAFDDCCGWLHPAPGRQGVILCGALNHEMLPLYQSWHALAAMIAASGLPVLRFDYHGTGDSPGSDRDSRRVEAWLASIHAAARFMREQAGMETISLVGIRLGATLAALSAAEIAAERIVLLAPVVAGRGYIREIQARSNMLAGMWRLSDARVAHGEIASDGFVLTAETAADISRVDLARLEKVPAREALVLYERRSPAVEKFTTRIERAGCSITAKSFDGYAAAMDSATLAGIPFDAWREVAAFLAKHARAEQDIPALPKTRGGMSTHAYSEERIVFGIDDRLAGVLCRPASGPAAATVIFLNTGGNAHFGWGRMSVEHARALAAHGVASLRMDIAGLGDAVMLEGSPRVALYRQESVADLREALDFLERRGHGNFLIVGHCSGAWLALNGALQDPRICGLFLVNLQRFIWTGKENLETLMAQAYRATDSYLQEIGSGVIWRRLLKGDINWPRLPGIAASVIRRAGARIASRVLPVAARMLGIETETARIRKMLMRLSGRGTRVCLVYSDTDPGREELARHFGPGGRRLQVAGLGTEIIANADHDITSEEARREYFNRLLNFLHEDKGADATPAQPIDLAEAA
jgi:alpha-beta hydrolase superfamily lysophospholipase